MTVLPFELVLSVLESKRLNKPIPPEAIEWLRAGFWKYAINGVPLEEALKINPPYQGSNMNAGYCYRLWLRGYFLTQAWEAFKAPPFGSPEFETFRELVKQMAERVKAGASPDEAWSAISADEGKFSRLLQNAFRYHVSVPTSKPRLEGLITSHIEATAINTFSDMLLGN